MDHREVGQYWNNNASAWTQLARAGYDVYRDHLNTPAFFEMLPDINELKGLDIGCGEGHNTRLLAKAGAEMIAIDIANIFVRHAQELEVEDPLGIEYQMASAVELPFLDGAFDFATGFMSFMDIPEIDRVLAEAYRVLKPGAFLQFSIEHPCFATPYRRKLQNEAGLDYAVEVGDYFNNLHGKVEEWMFSTAPSKLTKRLPKFKTPRFTRTLSQWINLLIRTGFQIEHVQEPCPSDAIVQQYPSLQDARVVAYFLHIRVRK